MTKVHLMSKKIVNLVKGFKLNKAINNAVCSLEYFN